MPIDSPRSIATSPRCANRVWSSYDSYIKVAELHGDLVWDARDG